MIIQFLDNTTPVTTYVDKNPRTKPPDKKTLTKIPRQNPLTKIDYRPLTEHP